VKLYFANLENKSRKSR